MNKEKDRKRQKQRKAIANRGVLDNAGSTMTRTRYRVRDDYSRTAIHDGITAINVGKVWRIATWHFIDILAAAAAAIQWLSFRAQPTMATLLVDSAKGCSFEVFGVTANGLTIIPSIILSKLGPHCVAIFFCRQQWPTFYINEKFYLSYNVTDRSTRSVTLLLENRKTLLVNRFNHGKGNITGYRPQASIFYRGSSYFFTF